MKIGILGGSFNPVHTGHVRMALEVLERCSLDRVELMPAKVPPHKVNSDILPFEFRLEMVERAIESIPGLQPNAVEGERAGPSFTCDTLTCYRTEQPEIETYFIMGASTFLELPKWRRGVDIPDLTNLVVVHRWEAAASVAEFVGRNWPQALQDANLWRLPGGTTIELVDTPRLDIKGRYLRRRWRERKSLALLVPPGVEAMLEERADEIETHWGKRI
ncbi:nicotinate (nicotinamide) nucleotide adenylyltransferase [Pseudodesulfovibrio sediminis]|uniref:Probable nicotinate-nucleotide adenylyltransferase n=1 Tax=Pseudodesulfovibrio sediminis TaxID=2810563 RepID=A0ABN6EY52_9BACT|nr:nicotinate (nicotinamide) nucleotide adenylyltransferase [Pseudodesulfovibrio sediminis]BCS90140.1 putative nicotinate-nucleotide adenylyltransferase [Pseudodesulfovibrio sediminis]